MHASRCEVADTQKCKIHTTHIKSMHLWTSNTCLGYIESSADMQVWSHKKYKSSRLSTAFFSGSLDLYWKQKWQINKNRAKPVLFPSPCITLNVALFLPVSFPTGANSSISAWGTGIISALFCIPTNNWHCSITFAILSQPFYTQAPLPHCVSLHFFVYSLPLYLGDIFYYI